MQDKVWREDVLEYAYRLVRVHSADIVLPLADGSTRELRLRCVVRPEREQQILLQRLRLTLPQRLSLNNPNVVTT